MYSCMHTMSLMVYIVLGDAWTDVLLLTCTDPSQDWSFINVDWCCLNNVDWLCLTSVYWSGLTNVDWCSLTNVCLLYTSDAADES